jgi:hypothetical protein
LAKKHERQPAGFILPAGWRFGHFRSSSKHVKRDGYFLLFLLFRGRFKLFTPFSQ